MGAITGAVEIGSPGIGTLTLSLMVCILLAMLLFYRAGWIKASEKFKTFLACSMASILVVYALSSAFQLFGIQTVLFDSGWDGLFFSVFVVVFVGLYLVWDFAFIAAQARRGVPKYMEWYGAFAILVTAALIYIQLLRLLAKAGKKEKIKSLGKQAGSKNPQKTSCLTGKARPEARRPALHPFNCYVPICWQWSQPGED